MDADDPTGRRQALVSALVQARRTDEPVAFVGDGTRIEYADRTIRLELDGDERRRLEEARSEFSVFKVQQPETRRADEGVVYLSALTDHKHAADFIEALFRDVYRAPAAYELRIEA